MFYSQYVLTKKGPLAKIWLAAHLQTKLTKAMVFQTDVRLSVERILRPDAPMALRLTSNLLLGVVRIFARKTRYLLVESSEVLGRMKVWSAGVDEVDGNRAPYASITIAGDADVDIDLEGLVGERRDSVYLAAERDITIGDGLGGLGDSFSLEPEVERGSLGMGLGLGLGLGLDVEEEPLLFTPSQPSLPSAGNAASGDGSRSAGVESVEVMRADKEQEMTVFEPDLFSAEKGTGGDVGLQGSTGDVPVPEGSMADAPQLLDDVSPGVPGITLEEPVEGEDGQDRRRASSIAADARLSLGDDLELAVEHLEGDAAAQMGHPPAKRGRKRKGTVIMDEETELSASAFRACLNDTSDLMRRPRVRRRVTAEERRDAGLRPEDILARSSVAYAPEVAAMFAEFINVDAILNDVASPMSDADLLHVGETQVPDLELSANSAVPNMEPIPEPEPDEPVPGTPVAASASQAVNLDKNVDSPSIGGPSGRTSMAPSMADGISPPRFSGDMDPSPAFDFNDTAPVPPSPPPPVEISLEGTPGAATLYDVSRTRAQVLEDDDADIVADGGGNGNEGRLSARTYKMHTFLEQHLGDDKSVAFSEALQKEKGVTRRTAARSFYELLNLCSHKVISLDQAGAFGDITVKPVQPAFDALRGAPQVAT